MLGRIKSFLFYLFVITIYLSAPICIFAVINIGVSIKYEVEEAHIFVNIDEKLSLIEKEIRHQEIDKHGRELKLEQSIWILMSVVLPVSATCLIVSKKEQIIK